MLLLPQRNPVYTAKETSTLDWLSGGRLDLGVGVGWLEEEFEALDVPWPRRGPRTDEYLQVLKTLWRDEVSSFEGEFYRLPPCSMFPKPLQDPHPPIHIGGESDAALRRAAHHGRGWHTFNRLPDDMTEPLATLTQHLADAGRSRADLEVTVCPYFHELTPERVEQYAEKGVDAVAVTFLVASPDDVPQALDALQPSQDRARGAS
jgi:probable F420-dependent oxidoreductase